MSRKCTSDVDLYENVGFCAGQASMPGMRPHFYMIKREDIVTFPKPKGNAAASMEGVVVISDDFVLAADKKWKRVDLIEGESEPSSKNQGSEGSRSFLNSVNLVLPGTEKKVTSLIALLNNDDVVIAYPQRGGAIRLIGNDMFRVQFELSQTAGKAPTDSANTGINASVTDIYPTPFYEGVIETEDGNIDGATDTLIVDPGE